MIFFLGLVGFLEPFGYSFGLFPFSIFLAYFWAALLFSLCG